MNGKDEQTDMTRGEWGGEEGEKERERTGQGICMDEPWTWITDCGTKGRVGHGGTRVESLGQL